jgi:hypothetical protein
MRVRRNGACGAALSDRRSRAGRAAQVRGQRRCAGDAARSGRSGAFPGVEINYGGAPDVQLHLGVPLAFDRGTQPGTRYGIGDAELGVKYRWVQETATTPMVAIYPTYALPTGSAARELGNGRPQVFLPVWLQKSFGPWTVDAGGGYWINHAPDARDNWYAGWLVQRKMNERLVLIDRQPSAVASDGAVTRNDPPARPTRRHAPTLLLLVTSLVLADATLGRAYLLGARFVIERDHFGTSPGSDLLVSAIPLSDGIRTDSERAQPVAARECDWR